MGNIFEYTYRLNEKVDGISRLQHVISGLRSNPDDMIETMEKITNSGCYFTVEGVIEEMTDNEDSYLFKIIPFEPDSNKLQSAYGNFVYAIAPEEKVHAVLNELNESKAVSISFDDEYSYHPDMNCLVCQCVDIRFCYLGYVDIGGDIHSISEVKAKIPQQSEATSAKKSGCYIATAVYGSYDCPSVWLLRRFRDERLASNLFGRIFIKCYYFISPTVVKLFGQTKWFNQFWRNRLDRLVARLKVTGIEDNIYHD